MVEVRVKIRVNTQKPTMASHFFFTSNKIIEETR